MSKQQEARMWSTLFVMVVAVAAVLGVTIPQAMTALPTSPAVLQQRLEQMSSEAAEVKRRDPKEVILPDGTRCALRTFVQPDPVDVNMALQRPVVCTVCNGKITGCAP